MNSAVRILGVCGIVAGLAGCNSASNLFDDQASSYHQADLIAPILLPQQAQTQAFVPLFDLPPRAPTRSADQRFEAPLPPVQGLTPSNQQRVARTAQSLDSSQRTAQSTFQSENDSPSAFKRFLTGIPLVGSVFGSSEESDDESDLNNPSEPFFRAPPAGMVPGTANQSISPGVPVAPQASAVENQVDISAQPAILSDYSASENFSTNSSANHRVSSVRVNKTVVQDELGRPILFIQSGLTPAHNRVVHSLEQAGLKTESTNDLSAIRITSRSGDQNLIYFSAQNQITSAVVLNPDMSPASIDTANALIDLISTNW